MRSGIVALVATCSIVLATSAHAWPLRPTACRDVETAPFVIGQSHVLSDPRSGLLLKVDGDGRHMSASTRAGKVVWHRNLFSDPALENLFPPPPHIEGQPIISDTAWARQMHSYVAHLLIDHIGIEPDCMVRSIDHDMPARFRNHYIRAGSGTHIDWLLDAWTGDFLMEDIN